MTDLTRVKRHNVGAVMQRARGGDACPTLSHFLHQIPRRSLTSCTKYPDALSLPAVMPRKVRERLRKTLEEVRERCCERADERAPGRCGVSLPGWRVAPESLWRARERHDGTGSRTHTRHGTLRKPN
jgi:hypothetical protein